MAWRVTAAIAALLLLAIAVRTLVKTRRPSEIVYMLLMVPIPAVGFSLYAAVSGAAPAVSWMTLVASLLLPLSIWWPLYGSLETMSTVTYSELKLFAQHLLARRACMVLAVTGYLYMFEPWLALANLVAIGAWTASWIPARRRISKLEISGKINATREAAFAFVAEPSNWSRYRPDIEVVSWQPDGPLAIGSEVTIRRATGWPAPRPDSFLERSVVRAMARFSVTRVSIDRPATITTESRSTETTTQLMQRSEWSLSLAAAVLGLRLDQDQEIDTERLLARRGYERLDELLGTPATSGS